MRTEIVRIGNSRGIRIPKPLIEQCGLEGTVELCVEKDRLIISPGRRLRQGWSEAFQNAGSADRDELMLQSLSQSKVDRADWKW